MRSVSQIGIAATTLNVDRLEHWRRDEIPLWNWFAAAFPGERDWHAWIRDVAGVLLRQPGPSRARVVKTNLVDAAQPAERISFDGAAIGIGRGPDNGIVLPEATITRNHARLRRDGESFLLEDLGSAMGTIVNGAKLSPAVPLELAHGDHFVIFPYRFELELEREWVAEPDAGVAASACGVGDWSGFRDDCPAGWELLAVNVEPLGMAACLAADRAFLGALSARLLDPVAETAPWVATSEALIELLLLAVMERANRDLSLPFRFSLGRMGRRPRIGDAARGVALSATLGLAGSGGAVRLFLPFDLLERMSSQWSGRRGNELARQASWRFRWSTGYVDLTAAERSSIEQGDVVLYEAETALLFPGDDRTGWLAAPDAPGHMRLSAKLDRRLNMAEARDDAPVSLQDLPLRVQILLGEHEMTLAQAELLAPGSVIDLERDPSDPVQLAVNGRVVGSGELVEIEGRLGVKILAWSAK